MLNLTRVNLRCVPANLQVDSPMGAPVNGGAVPFRNVFSTTSAAANNAMVRSVSMVQLSGHHHHQRQRVDASGMETEGIVGGEMWTTAPGGGSMQPLPGLPSLGGMNRSVSASNLLALQGARPAPALSMLTSFSMHPHRM